MKKYIVLLFLLSFFACQEKIIDSDNTKKNFVEKGLDRLMITKDDWNLIGDVKSFVEYELLLDDVPVNKGVDTHGKSHSFDKKGRLLKEVWFVGYDKNIQEEVKNYLYNEKGYLIELNEFEHNEVVTNKQTFIYDNDSKLIELIDSHQNRLNSTKTVFIYQEDKIILEEYTIRNDTASFIKKSIFSKYGDKFENLSPIPFVKYKFDEKGRIIKKERLTLNGSIDYFIKKEYNDNNDLTRETTYDSLNKITNTVFYIYSTDGTLYEEIEINEDGIRINHYDKNKSVIGDMEISLERNHFLKSTNKFDKYGNFLGKTIVAKTEEDGIEEFNNEYFSYEYDEIGNWITKKELVDDSLIIIAEREILYY